jgi:hypothetical protein
MARSAPPWYFTEKKADAATIKGPASSCSKARSLPPISVKLKSNSGTSSRAPSTTPCPAASASPTSRYLALHKPRYLVEAFAGRLSSLQLFAEAHRFRKVNDRDCLPVHVEEWIAAGFSCHGDLLKKPWGCFADDEITVAFGDPG